MGLTLRFMLGLALFLFCITNSVSSRKRSGRDTNNAADKGNSSTNTAIHNVNAAAKLEPKTEAVEDAAYTNDRNTKLNGAVNSNYLHTTDSNRSPTKLQKSEPYSYKKSISDENVGIESTHEDSKSASPTENDEGESHFKDTTYPSGRAETGRSFGFDVKKYFSPEFHSRNNVYTISLASENDRFASPDFDEKFHSFKEPDFSSYFETTSEYTVPHDDYFDKLREEHEDFDIKLGEPGERKEKPEFDIDDRFRKPTDSDRSESKDTTFNTPVEKLKKNDNDTKLDVDFVKFKRIENNGKKNKNGVRKNVVTEKRTSIDYNSSFNKTEIIGKDDNKSVPDIEPENDEFEFSDIKIHDNPLRDKPTLKEIVTSTHKSIIYHPTVKKSASRKPPSSTNSHIPLLNNNIEIDLKKLNPTNTKEITTKAPKTEIDISSKFVETSTRKEFTTTKASKKQTANAKLPIATESNRFIESTTRTELTPKTSRNETANLKISNTDWKVFETTTKAQVTTSKSPKKVTEAETGWKKLLETTTKAQITASKPPKRVAEINTGREKLLETSTKVQTTNKPPKKVSVVPSIIPLHTSVRSTTAARLESSTKSSNSEKETITILQRKTSPINVFKRGSIKFNSPTTEVNRYRNGSIRNTGTTKRSPTRLLNLNNTSVNTSDVSVQENSSAYTQSARPDLQKSSNVLPFLRNYSGTRGFDNFTPKSPTSVETILTSSSTTEATRISIRPLLLSKPVYRRPSTKRTDVPIYTPALAVTVSDVDRSTTSAFTEVESTMTTMTTPDVTQPSTSESVPLNNYSTYSTSNATNTETASKETEASTLAPVPNFTEITATITANPTTTTTTIAYDDVSYSSEVSFSSSSSRVQKVNPAKANISYTVLIDTNKPTADLNNSYDVSQTTEEYTPDTTASSENKAVAISLSTTGAITTVDAFKKNNGMTKQKEKHGVLTTEESVVDYEDTNDDGMDEDDKKLPNPSEETDHMTFVPDKFKPIEKIHNSDVEKNINDVPSETTIPLSYDPSVEVTTNFELQRPKSEGNGGTIAAITISCVGAVCLILLAVLLVLMRKRQKRFNYGQRCTPVSLDAYSMDNVSVYNSVRRKALRGSKRSYGNPAFDDPSSVAHPLNFPALTKFATNVEDVMAEFEEIPQVTARTNELPEGCDTKNRYANVIPLPETRVSLAPIEGYPNSDYINANYVTGPKGIRGYYIACQAPLQNTVDDFWRMIWEQQSKVVLMLTHLYENGVEKCADYLPPSEITDCHRLFGDFQVTLKRREVKDKYIISSLQLKNMVSNSWREVTHFWYLGWPEKGVPLEANSLIAFLIEARSYVKGPLTSENQNKNKGRNATEQAFNPIVVHCSPGTGRTGTIIACDIAIREFELTRQIDLPKIVYRIRRDRASAVQTKEQYIFIYKVVNLYATKLAGGAFDSL